MTDRPFGFYVERERVWKDDYSDFPGVPVEPPRWYVGLPHQCDSWEIVGDYPAGAPTEEAIELLTAFITEAQQALETLKANQETKPPA